MSEDTGSSGEGTVESSGEDLSPSSQESGSAQEASTPSGSSKPQQEAPKTFKVKVDGQELDVSEADLVKDYQLKQASNKRMQQASGLKKQADEILSMFEKDPKAALKHIEKSKNPQLRAAVEDYLLEYIKLESMDPKERALMEKDAKIREYEERDKAAKQKEDQAFQERLDQETGDKLSGDIASMLEKSNLPATTFTVSRVAYMMLAAAENEIDMTAEEAVQLVEESEIGGYKSALSKLEGDRLLQILGDDIAEKIRKADLGRLKSTPTSAKQQARSEKPGSKASGKKSQMSWDDYISSLKFDD